MSAAMDWKSSQRFFVNPRYVVTNWSEKPDARYRIAFMNRCLCLFFRALENVEKAERSDFDHGWEMRKQLNELANTGWELRGPGDLNSALKYLKANHGFWWDDETDPYVGGPTKIYPRKLDAPEAFVRFADALDSRLAQLAADLRGYVTATEAVTTDVSTGSWDGCQKNLNRITGTLKKVDNSLWLMDTVELVTHKATLDFFQKTSKALGTYGGAVGKFGDIVGRIDAVAKTKIGVEMATRGTGVAEEASDALAAMRATVDFLPILGAFYGAAIDAAPALISSFRSSLESHLRRANRAYKGLPLTTPNPPTCAICLMQTAQPCK